MKTNEMKKVISTTLSITILTFLIVSCDNRPLKTIERVGLNDTAYYTFERNTDNVISVRAKKYMFSPFYSISINSDTISIGQDFEGCVGAYRVGSYKIIIEEPRSEIIEGTYQLPPEGEPDEPHIYKFETIRTGNFKFRGKIEFDTLVIPFEYNFIVMQD